MARPFKPQAVSLRYLCNHFTRHASPHLYNLTANFLLFVATRSCRSQISRLRREFSALDLFSRWTPRGLPVCLHQTKLMHRFLAYGRPLACCEHSCGPHARTPMLFWQESPVAGLSYVRTEFTSTQGPSSVPTTSVDRLRVLRHTLCFCFCDIKEYCNDLDDL